MSYDGEGHADDCACSTCVTVPGSDPQALEERRARLEKLKALCVDPEALDWDAVEYAWCDHRERITGLEAELARVRAALAHAEEERDTAYRLIAEACHISTDPIPEADIARAASFVRERGWVTDDEKVPGCPTARRDDRPPRDMADVAQAWETRAKAAEAALADARQALERIGDGSVIYIEHAKVIARGALSAGEGKPDAPCVHHYTMVVGGMQCAKCGGKMGEGNPE